VYLRIWTRHTQEALFTAQLGDGTYFGVSAFMARTDPLPIIPTSTMRAAEEEPMTRARGDGRATDIPTLGGEIITIPDSPQQQYDDLVIRTMVYELDELNIPVPNVMVPPDQLSPLERYLDNLGLEGAALGPPILQREVEDDAMSSGTLVEDEEPYTTPRMGGAHVNICGALTITPGEEELDYSPASGAEISAQPTPSPLPSTPATPCLTLEDISPEGTPTEGSPYSGPQHSVSIPFSPAPGPGIPLTAGRRLVTGSMYSPPMGRSWPDYLRQPKRVHHLHTEPGLP